MEQFDAIRKHFGVADFFCESLCRSKPWNSLGGKSGSSFLKTLGVLPASKWLCDNGIDDRYILKQLSKTEAAAFTIFAPAYFQYIGEALFHKVKLGLFVTVSLTTPAPFAIDKDLWLFPNIEQKLCDWKVRQDGSLGDGESIP